MREIQIKSDKKGTQVALSSKRKITRARNVYTHYTHVGKNCGSSSSTGLTWLNYHPNFMNILKCFAWTTNTCDRSKYVCVCVKHLRKYHHFQQCGWALLFYCRPPNSDKTFVSLKITAQLFPLFLPCVCAMHIYLYIFFGLFCVSSSPLHIK